MKWWDAVEQNDADEIAPSDLPYPMMTMNYPRGLDPENGAKMQVARGAKTTSKSQSACTQRVGGRNKTAADGKISATKFLHSQEIVVSAASS